MSSLLNTTNHVSAPYIKVIIGEYVFGVYQRTEANDFDEAGFYKAVKITYPNYVQSLRVSTLNGQFNEYTLELTYPVTNNDDPNFFEKVFSSVSKTRRINFTYGDALMPTYIYKDEEAIITEVKTRFDLKSSTISYTVEAVSAAMLSQSGVYTFIGGMKKPSDVIKQVLYNPTYGLQEVFPGMNNRTLVEEKGLIAGNDKVVGIATKENITPIDYILYLVSCMIPASSIYNKIKQKTFYVLNMIDDTSGEFGGPYFKVSQVTKYVEHPEAYDIDIGFPTANIVTNFSIDNNENYSLYYDWQTKLNGSSYTRRLNNEGKWEDVYSPILSSNNEMHLTRVSDQTWWSKVTEYPITAQLTLKGLLRPAILMSYVRLNVLFFGKKHIASGLYIVTKQVNNISKSGYFTTLSLTRIDGEDEEVA